MTPDYLTKTLSATDILDALPEPTPGKKSMGWAPGGGGWQSRSTPTTRRNPRAAAAQRRAWKEFLNGAPLIRLPR